MIYFISRTSGLRFDLWGQQFDPERGVLLGEPFEVKAFDAPALIISPDVGKTDIGVASRQLVLTMQSTTGNIWMLEGVDR
jgi:hypothetical protein